MGLGKASYSSYDKPKVETVEKSIVPPNPNPKNFIILSSVSINGNLAVMVIYPDCTTYEGKKVLVYENCGLGQLLKQKSVDPHFSENEEFISPFARFEPTKKGWKAALNLAEFL
jgi:hypothetical protein